VASTSWAALLKEVAAERRASEARLEPMHLVEQANPEMAEGFRRLRAAKQQHREVLVDMLVKSDPYTFEPKRASKIPRNFNQGVTPCGSKRS
jgi:hypothetical protein